MDLRAWRERGWDTATVREPSSSILLSFSLGCADIRTHSCALQGRFWSFVLLSEGSGRRFAWLQGRRGVGTFNVISIEHAEVIVAGAEAAIAGSAAVPVALDHATGTELVREAAGLGDRNRA